MLNNDVIQAALIAYLKANTTIVGALTLYESTSNEIREDSWKGGEFIYPNIRIKMLSNSPGEQSWGCDVSNISVSIMVFTESQSSYEAEYICGIINTILHKRQFVSNNLAFALRTSNLAPAVPASERVWRSECMLLGVVSG